MKITDTIPAATEGSRDTSGYAVESTLFLARRVLDDHALVFKQFYEESLKEQGGQMSELSRRYAAQYNSLVDLRKKLNQETASQMVRWDGPEATQKIYFSTTTNN